ncbi:MAG: methyltransferase domain-containing protein [Patescibacteria group bacterium]
MSSLQKLILKIGGYQSAVLWSDPAAFDRLVWLRRNLGTGNLRVLDAGCGSGAFTFCAAKRGGEAIGISFDERNNHEAVERADILGLKNVKFVHTNLNQLDLLAKDLGLFDEIICFETIEHIMDDKKLLKNFCLFLKPGGHILLTTPYKYYRHFPGDGVSEVEDGNHVRWGYTFKEMNSLLVASGFKVNKEEYVTGFISQYLCRIAKVLDRMFHNLGWFVTFPLRIFQILDKPISDLLGYPYLSICVVAEKI